MKEYTIFWEVNNGATYGTFKSGNFRNAVKDANEICKGNVQRGGNYRYTISLDGRTIHEVQCDNNRPRIILH